MKYIDTHAHLNFDIYDSDRTRIIEDAQKNQCTIINVGTQVANSRYAVELADRYEHIYAIIGLHPIHTLDYHNEEGIVVPAEEFDTNYYRDLVQSSSKVVGIGECGFDYYRNNHDTQATQEAAFRAQIELALELDLPLMLHIRPSEGSMDAYEDVLSLLQEYTNQGNLRGQVHFFAGTQEIAQMFLDLGFYISFTGVITFAGSYEKLIKYIPENRILSETDAPYVTPHPHRGKRNEPEYVRFVTAKIARIKKRDESEIADRIYQNAQELYGV